LNAQKVQEQIDALHYWDARVLRLSCEYFADEVVLVYESSDGNVTYKFNGCYKIVFDHALGYEKEKPTRELTYSQLPYFLQDVEVGEIVSNGMKLYACSIVMPPLSIEIWCKEIFAEK